MGAIMSAFRYVQLPVSLLETPAYNTLAQKYGRDKAAAWLARLYIQAGRQGGGALTTRTRDDWRHMLMLSRVDTNRLEEILGDLKASACLVGGEVVPVVRRRGTDLMPSMHFSGFDLAHEKVVIKRVKEAERQANYRAVIREKQIEQEKAVTRYVTPQSRVECNKEKALSFSPVGAKTQRALKAPEQAPEKAEKLLTPTALPETAKAPEPTPPLASQSETTPPSSDVDARVSELEADCRLAATELGRAHRWTPAASAEVKRLLAGGTPWSVLRQRAFTGMMKNVGAEWSLSREDMVDAELHRAAGQACVRAKQKASHREVEAFEKTEESMAFARNSIGSIMAKLNLNAAA